MVLSTELSCRFCWMESCWRYRFTRFSTGKCTGPAPLRRESNLIILNAYSIHVMERGLRFKWDIIPGDGIFVGYSIPV